MNRRGGGGGLQYPAIGWGVLGGMVVGPKRPECPHGPSKGWGGPMRCFASRATAGAGACATLLCVVQREQGA